MNVFRCLFCDGSFPADIRRRFCKLKCRQKWHAQASVRKSSELWASLVAHAFDFEMEAKITGFDDSERVKKAITELAPPGAAFFRLGCPNPKENSEKQMVLRWFPGPL